MVKDRRAVGSRLINYIVKLRQLHPQNSFFAYFLIRSSLVPANRRTFRSFLYIQPSLMMLSPPHHPGNPKWKKRTEWVKTLAPTSTTMPLSATEEQQDLLDRFKLQDESNQGNAWGQVDLHPNNQGSAGWGWNPMESSEACGRGGW